MEGILKGTYTIQTSKWFKIFYNKDDLFETLRGAKVDPAFWRTLTVAEVMRIDYKAFNSPTMKARGIKDIGIATAIIFSNQHHGLSHDW